MSRCSSPDPVVSVWTLPPRSTSQTCRRLAPLFLAISAFSAGVGAAEPAVVDFRFAPPEWQTAVCFPDDPCKTLVDRSGELLYHYGQGGREFGTRVGVDLRVDALWERQWLEEPTRAEVTTRKRAAGLEIEEVAFAVAKLTPSGAPRARLRRVDGGGVLRNWAQPPPGTDPSLRDIVVHHNGSIRYELEVTGQAGRVALVLCEGWWNEPGKRIQSLRVEGAPPRRVDTVADLGRNKAGVFWFQARDANADGRIEMAVEAAPESADRNTILNGLWAFPFEAEVDDAALLAGQANAKALARLALANPGGPPRNDLILVRVRNRADQPRTVHPSLIVDTTLPFQYDPGRQQVQVNGHEVITTSLKMTGPRADTAPRREIELAPLTVPANQDAEFHVLYSGGGEIVIHPRTVAEARSCLFAAREFWDRSDSPVPRRRIEVPSAALQGLVDVAVRNIWQAREIKGGLPVFQVGPTCYRGLWLVDGAFILEAATILGAGKEARNGIAYTLAQQKPSGAFEVLSPQYYKENGIVLWTCARHALLTQDKAWLESVWPQLEGAAGSIRELRRRSRANDTPLDDGLNPPGEIDGGLSGAASGFQRPEFSNVHWNLLGLRSFIHAARWLGKGAVADAWQGEYDDLYATFRKAAERDVRQDSRGNAYVPIFMANAGPELPQRAQWTFCHAVYPGQVFARDDPLVASTLAMLEATEREGMVYGTGWDAAGIWNYFASFYGHAWLWQGNGRKAAEVLYAFANHAAPTGVWREEQSLKGEPFKKVGDMPHNWASAEFIRLVVHLLALDRGEELHLLEGFPREWAAAGLRTGLNGVATPFGPLDLAVRAEARGLSVTVKPLAANCRAVIVHLPDGSTRRLDPAQGGTVTFP